MIDPFDKRMLDAMVDKCNKLILICAKHSKTEIQNNFFLGGGLIWGQNTKYNDKIDEKIGFTNLYAAIKYKFEINDSNCFIYPLFQVKTNILF